MNTHKWRFAALFCPLLLVAACGRPSDEQRATALLDYRLQDRLASDIAAGNAAVQPLPNGAQVTLLGAAQFPPAAQMQDATGHDVRANVIEALLDPRLIHIQVADTSALPDYQRDARVRDMRQYLAEYGLGSTLQPAAAIQPAPAVAAGAAPAGLTIAISVECPDHYARLNSASDQANPYCH